MNDKNTVAQIATIHNMLAEISVKGDDTIRMAQALQMCRMLVERLNTAEETSDSNGG